MKMTTTRLAQMIFLLDKTTTRLSQAPFVYISVSYTHLTLPTNSRV